jgi:hypothetical protein
MVNCSLRRRAAAVGNGRFSRFYQIGPASSMKLPKQRCQISTIRDQLRYSSKLALEITAAETIYTMADAKKAHMGLTTWKTRFTAKL